MSMKDWLDLKRPKQNIKETLKKAPTREALYQEIMKLGTLLPRFPENERIDSNLVSGCQSIMHLHSEVLDGKIYFIADSDALISKGLAALLIDFYNGCAAEEVLKVSPDFLEELKIPQLLSPSRANGLASLYVKMKQQALAHLVSH